MATVNYFRYRGQSAKLLKNVLDYVCRGDKTVTADGERLVSGVGCSPEFAWQEFQMLRAAHGQDSPKWFYHYTQSFHPEEPITAQQAHELAKEYAARAWPGCQVLIATHVDARHVHSHFVVNAVRFEDGKMLRIDPKSLDRLRRLSDELCREHGYSTLPPDRPRHNQGVSLREERSALKGQSWKFRLMVTVEDCMKVARSREDFLRRMERQGYRVRWEESRKSITYTTPSGMKCRDLRLHEDKFRKKNMEAEFEYRREILERLEADRQSRLAGGGQDRALRHGDREELAGGSPGTGRPGATAGAAPGGAAGVTHLGGPAGLSGGAEGLEGASQAGDGGVPVGHGAGGGGDSESAFLTGWEAEREQFELALQAGAEDETIAPEAVLAEPDSQLDAAALGADAAMLAADLSGMIDHGPVQDSTTARHRRKKQKKAPVQKDGEREENYEQKM